MQGEQGNLLSRQTEIIVGIKEDWSHLYLILSLLENVVPHEAVSDQFQDITSRLGTTPMLIDAKAQTETLVVRHRLGQCNPTTSFQHSVADYTDIPPNHVAFDKPHSHTTPARRSGQRLGNPHSTPTQPIVPLPNHSSQF